MFYAKQGKFPINTTFSFSLNTKRQESLNKFSRGSLLAVFCKKDALKTSPNSQENTCARLSFLIKLQATLAVETSVSDIVSKTKISSFSQVYIYSVFKHREKNGARRV